MKNPPAKDDRRRWTYGLTGARLQNAPRKWKAIGAGEDAYWPAGIDDPDPAAIPDAFDIRLPMKQYTYGERMRMKQETDVFGTDKDKS